MVSASASQFESSIPGLASFYKQPFILVFTPFDSFEFFEPNMLAKSQAGIGITCKLHTGGPELRFEPKNLLTLRELC